MTEKYYVLVAGNGETSRANIEALMDDHYYAHGPNGVLVLAYEKAPSRGQTFAAQFAREKTKDVVVFCNEDAQTIGIPGSTMYPSEDPINSAVKEFKEATAFILWSDEDEISLSVLKACKNSNIPAFNLCDGLVPLSAVEGAGDPVKPVIPKQEVIAPKEPEVFEDEDDTVLEPSIPELDEEDDYEEDMEPEEVLYAAMSDIAEVFADVVFEKLKERLNLKPE